MNRKGIIWLGVGIGSTLGSLIPFLWSPDAFMSSVVFGAIGGVLGIWAAVKLTS